MRLTVNGVTVTIAGTDLVTGAALDVASGTVMGILGPNGSGKSTLLRTVYRLLRPAVGTVRIDADDVWRLAPREVARRVGVVTQESTSDFDLEVLDVVLMGRTPHKSMFAQDNDNDLTLALDALSEVDALHLADRMIATLSGGEKQRVLLARALVQQTSLLLLDEPTNHLDIAFQLDLLRLVRNLGVTVVAALHDLNLAAGYCDTVAVLDAGRVVAVGSPRQVLNPELLFEVFGVRAHQLTHPATGELLLAFSEPGAPHAADLSLSALDKPLEEVHE